MRGVHVHEHHGAERCPYCHGQIGKGALWICPGCETPHHADCAQENGACTILGCRRSFAGRGVAPPRAVRPLPRGGPRSDFRVGAILAAIGVPLAAIVSASNDPDARIFAVIYNPFLCGGVLAMGWALWRALREGRWSR